MTFPERLRDLRTQKRISQTQLAQTTGMHYTQIGRYERGASAPSANALQKLAGALEVSTDFLMEGTTEEAAKAHLNDRELLHQFKQVESLDGEDKHVVKVFLNAFLTKRQIQQLAKA